MLNASQSPAGQTPTEVPDLSAPQLLRELRRSSLVLNEEWEALPKDVRNALALSDRPTTLLAGLEKHGLLTAYQAQRILAGKMFGLVLGNYRVLSPLGKGGMGEVFKAEQIVMRKLAAVKVLKEGFHPPPGELDSFHAEMRAVARLNHPNIVAAFDAGVCADANPNEQVLHYLVMEYVPGENLDQYVRARGPLPVALGCDLIGQVAAALGEAHKQHLVHRDIKPPNIVVTPEGQAKLLDFGLARCTRDRPTNVGAIVGTIGYMAPEQVQDASGVDIRADIFALGGTLSWCLTGQPPFPSDGNLMRDLMARLRRQAPSVRAARPDVPAALDAVIARMLAFRPEDRYLTPQSVAQALRPFAQLDVRPTRVTAGKDSLETSHRVLIVDDDPDNRLLCRFALAEDSLTFEEAEDGPRGLQLAGSQRPDLVLLDLEMPGLAGERVLRQLRESPPIAHCKIIMMSAAVSGDEMSELLAAGADDYISKPLSIVQLQARVRAALRLKDAQDRGDRLNSRMVAALSSQQAQTVSGASVSRGLELAVAELLGQRTGTPAARLRRLQRYTRCLAEAAGGLPAFADRISPDFLRVLDTSVPLHDIGTLALPDQLLLKPGNFTEEERRIMQTHTIKGAEVLSTVGRHFGTGLEFPVTAVEIARHHHERYDGKGYPDRLGGEDIPLAARLTAVADVYNALRSRRAYRPAFSHPVAVRIMTEGSPGQFDPQLLRSFLSVADLFERTFREMPDWQEA